jgi:hypothetical protein
MFLVRISMRRRFWPVERAIFVLDIKNCVFFLKSVVGLWNKSSTDSDLRGGCPYIRNYVSSCRKDSRVHGRQPRAVEGSTPKKMTGLESEVMKAG